MHECKMSNCGVCRLRFRRCTCKSWVLSVCISQILLLQEYVTLSLSSVISLLRHRLKTEQNINSACAQDAQTTGQWRHWRFAPETLVAILPRSVRPSWKRVACVSAENRRPPHSDPAQESAINKNICKTRRDVINIRCRHSRYLDQCLSSADQWSLAEVSVSCCELCSLAWDRDRSEPDL